MKHADGVSQDKREEVAEIVRGKLMGGMPAATAKQLAVAQPGLYGI